MAENKEYMIHQEDDGSIQISEDVLASIASTTALEVDGVSALMSANVSDLMGGKKMTCKGVRVELDGEQIVVGIFVAVRYGCAISDVAKKVQKNVHTALEGMTGFKVAAVNVHVGGISFNCTTDEREKDERL